MRLIQGRIYTADPADADPNASAPAAANIVRLPMQGFLFAFDNDGAATVTCSWGVWLLDEVSGDWFRVANGTGLDRRIFVAVEPHENAPQNGDSASVFIELDRTGGANLGAGETLTLRFYKLPV